MPLTDTTPSDSCWECLRRELPCDGAKPVCIKCHGAGLVCPGFNSRRPLTWVTPGKITHRAPQRPSRRRSRIAAKPGPKSEACEVESPARKSPTVKPDLETAAVIPIIPSKALTVVQHPASCNTTTTNTEPWDRIVGGYTSGYGDWANPSSDDRVAVAGEKSFSVTTAWSSSPALDLDSLHQRGYGIPASPWVEDNEFLVAFDYCRLPDSFPFSIAHLGAISWKKIHLLEFILTFM